MLSRVYSLSRGKSLLLGVRQKMSAGILCKMPSGRGLMDSSWGGRRWAAVGDGGGLARGGRCRC